MLLTFENNMMTTEGKVTLCCHVKVIQVQRETCISDSLVKLELHTEKGKERELKKTVTKTKK